MRSLDGPFWRSILLLVVGTTLSMPTSAQNVPSQHVPAQNVPAAESTAFDETIDVSLIEIDVVVADPGGQTIQGLAREDFIVRVDGRKVDVTHFAAIHEGAAVPNRDTKEPVPAPPRTRDDRNHLVIYVDHAHLAPGEWGDTAAAVKAFLRTAMRPDDRVMVVEAHHDLRIRQPFTTVPELAIAALDGLAPEASKNHTLGELRELLQEMERKVQEGPDVLARGRGTGPRDFKTRIDNVTVRIFKEIERSTRQLHRLLPALAGLPGRRVLVYVGGAPPTEAGRTLLSAWRSAFGPGSRYQLERDATAAAPGNNLAALESTGGGVSEVDAERLFEAVAQTANDHGVTLYALDTGGLRANRDHIGGQDSPGIRSGGGAQTTARAHDLSRRTGNPQALRMLAEETGGRAAINTRAFGAALGQLGSDLRNRYVLAFPPPAARGKEPRARHRIEVRLKRSAAGARNGRLDVRHRQSRRSRNVDYQEADRATSALLLGTADNPLDIALRLEPAQATSKNTWTVPVLVTIPVGRISLLAEGDLRRGRLSIYLTAGDWARGASQVGKVVVPLELPASAIGDDPKQRIEYPVALPVAAGSTALAVTVRDDLRPLSGTVRATISPPID